LNNLPKITFGIIVLNGEPFNKYCLRSIYPFAHEIIIVEGGHEATNSVTTSDGHSIDGTLEKLWNFKREEDAENKIQIITKKGYWKKSDEFGHDRTHQSRAYAEKATGDYLWQIDIDEFYLPQDIKYVIDMLRRDNTITAVSFKTIIFWGSINYQADGWYFRRGANIFHRIFKWGKNYKYVTHEPPTVFNANGKNLRDINWRSGNELARKNIWLYHYALLFPWQVKQKTSIYKDEKPILCSDIMKWADNSYFNLNKPFNVERHYWYPSWLKRYEGKHPPEVIRMMKDIKNGVINIETRKVNDIEKLLNTWWYPICRNILILLDLFDRLLILTRESLKKIKKRIKEK
jgi:hypothetical protein